ncbi:hypothetical protein FDC58_14935 [Clostridium botulinum]|uniref:Uncharacterized protein n=1 Tax=Clostridium botulinum TaxID=1491 RepID=A0A0A0V0B7_CLOBO|nr:hypothetical protein [Clostridium botulinum]AIW54618.1 hypothetical protein [Clostridium botulinum]AIW54737.1 hypothetical protein [Clostridium botulinum]AIW54867.1 hypothetical protein [Clostridium botulinum]MBY7009318.1 hypothetical protein [Clostridium botulinum]NFH74454.1 hypothetical protein [Clostridium botulinum]
MKKVFKIFFTFLMIIILNNVNAYAEPIIENKNVSITNIEVKANVPTGFNKTIYVNFKLEDGTNALYTLIPQENYIYNGVIPIGQAQVNFINIVENNNEYKYSSAGALGAYEGQKTKFTIDVQKDETTSRLNKKIPNNENQQKEAENIGGNHTQEDLEANRTDTVKSDENKEAENLQEDKNKESKDIKKDEDINKQANTFFKKYFITITLLIICSIAYLTMKIKKRNR